MSDEQLLQRLTKRENEILTLLAEEVTARNIKDVRVLFMPGKRFKQALDAAEFRKESLS